MSHTVKVSDEDWKFLKQVQERKQEQAGEDSEEDWSPDETAHYLFKVACGRLNALWKDNKRRDAGKPAVMREVTVKVLGKKEKKAKAPKAPKTKAPKAKAPKPEKPAKAKRVFTAEQKEARSKAAKAKRAAAKAPKVDAQPAEVTS